MTEPQAGPTGGAGSAGALLRAARERQGLHIAALAASIKVSPRKLEALEGDRYDELPDATFTRALAQTVCRSLKIDARAVLDLMPPAPLTVALEPARGGLNAPFRDRPGREDPGLVAGAARKPMLWATLLFILAALAVIFVPGHWWMGLQGAPVVAPVAAPASAPLAPDLAASAPVLAASGAMLAASQPLIETVFAAQGPEAAASEPATAPVAPAVTGLAAPNAASPPPVPANTPAVASLLQLRSTEASWVEVRDGNGQLLLSRTVQPGETVGVDGSLPMRLVIGNAAGTQLAFRGRPYDLGPSTRENVARVELR
ncbi:helix-turn-helix domain-containing protein [Rubrivivax rivuli]|uniref:Helix-turn-helix domain-containing protein n=1 Tax=Rubrivivax rivuli TaxID=1862385 RepID=A0A437RFH4_9BURK|nr:helix-turn-helix domain-containing protein [Rubrivivax rivuli]RVU45464.1 helix-turn-helix domain-containing protein [Rubrivivax rivuli]